MEVPEEWMRWGIGGAVAAAGAAAAAVGRAFKGNVDSVRQEVRALDERTRASMDDLWEVINTERDIASKARERNFDRLEKTPTREEMQAGLRDVKADIGKLADLIRSKP